MQSAMERAGIVPSPNSTPKVLAFENVKDIARAVRYADEELHAHLELRTADDTEGKLLLLEGVANVVSTIHLAKPNRDIAQSIDKLLKNVDELDQAATDLLSGAHTEIAELMIELEGSQSSNANISSTIPIAMIDAELRRRSKASKLIGTIQEGLEDDKAKAEERLAIVKQQLLAGVSSREIKSEKRTLTARLKSLEATIDSIIEAVRVNSEKEGRLSAYKSALALIEEGLPEGIFGEKLCDRVEG
jgi:hypothetical protein